MTPSVFNRLLEQMKKGDMSALEPIYTEYYRKLEVTAISILHNKNDGQDAASEAILRLISYAQKHEKFNIDSPGAFMYTIVRNIAYDRIDKVGRLVELDDSMCVGDAGLYEHAEITSAIMSLQEPEREIGTMFYIYDCKISMIAEKMNMPTGTVKWHISKIKKALKDRLK